MAVTVWGHINYSKMAFKMVCVHVLCFPKCKSSIVGSYTATISSIYTTSISMTSLPDTTNKTVVKYSKMYIVAASSHNAMLIYYNVLFNNKKTVSKKQTDT